MVYTFVWPRGQNFSFDWLLGQHFALLGLNIKILASASA